MTYADDPDGYRERLDAKLRPDRIRATLAFAGLFQMTHELIKQAVLEEVRTFYCTGWEPDGLRYDEQGYETQVLSRAPKNRFRASLLWFVEMEAITLAQADRLDDIYNHRHDLTHELIKYVVDPAFEPDVDLLTHALTVLRAIRRFWTGIEIDIGSFQEAGEVNLDEVMPLSLLVLEKCIAAFVDGLEDAPDMQPGPAPHGGAGAP